MEVSMKQIHSFVTDRLRARKMTPGDLDDLASMYQNSEVMAALGGERSREQTLEFLDAIITHFDTHGFSYWVIEDKETGAFMGRGGLKHVHIDGADEVELGYAFLPEYWGKGIATEIGKELLRIGFEEFGLESITCFSLPENKVSQRVMEKLGFEFEKNCVYKTLPHVFYRLTKERWQELKDQ